MRDRVVWAATIAYAAIFTALGSLKYLVHRNLVDFGIFAQTAASVPAFRNAVEGSHWAFHFSPILLVAGGLLEVWRSPFALIALQSLACALVIPPVCDIVERGRGTAAARLTAGVLFLYPALAGLAFNDFHENAFAPAAVAWMVWAFDAGSMTLMLVFAALTLAVKEDQAIFLAIASAVVLWRFRGTSWARAAGLVLAASLVVLIKYFSYVQPHAVANPGWQPVRFYAWSASDFATLLPAGVLGRLGFVVLAFTPLLFIPFRSRAMWLAAAPLAEVLLSRMPTTYTLGSHYAGAWLGYVLAAFAFGVCTLSRERAELLLRWCFVPCAIVLLVANPLHPGLNLRLPQARDAALDRAIAWLPPGARVATQEEAYGHLALSDPNATVLPEKPDRPIDACYVLVDADWPESPRLVEYGATLAALVRRGEYVAVHRDAGATIYRRSSCPVPR
ncbi:MAG: DUF2079 domain-containing protein [Vulcanimicrobiaceae bacterium]